MKCYVSVVETREVTLPEELFKKGVAEETIFNAASIAFMNSKTVIESFVDCIENEENDILYEK